MRAKTYPPSKDRFYRFLVTEIKENEQIEASDWLRESVAGRYVQAGESIYFERDDDRTLFLLRWSGA